MRMHSCRQESAAGARTSDSTRPTGCCDFYGFSFDELVVAGDRNLDLDIDPKLAWALANRERFPIDVR